MQGSYAYTTASGNVAGTTQGHITYGTKLGGTQLAATANVPGTTVYTLDEGTTDTTGATPTAGAHTLHAVFTPTDTVNYTVTPQVAAGWAGLLNLLDEAGPDQIVRRIRAIEAVGPEGRPWPRNKRSDDATIVYAR